VLALADELVVTGDSASMLAEAVRARHPLAIAPLPARAGRRRRRVALVRRLLPRWAFDLLVDLGLVTSLRDVTLLHRRLLAEGLASLLPAAPASPKQDFTDDLEIAAGLVRDVIANAEPSRLPPQ
jgi:hypothetical protein